MLVYDYIAPTQFGNSMFIFYIRCFENIPHTSVQ